MPEAGEAWEAKHAQAHAYMYAGSKVLACTKHVRLSSGSPSMDPHGQLSAPGSPPSPCTRNLKEGSPPKLGCDSCCPGKLCLSSESSNTCMNTYAGSEQGTLMGPTSQTEKQAGKLIVDACGSWGGVHSLLTWLCKGDGPFMPVLVSPEAAILLLYGTCLLYGTAWGCLDWVIQVG